MYVCKYIHVHHMCVGTHEGQKKVHYPWEVDAVG